MNIQEMNFESAFELYKKEILIYLRTDEEVFDILLTPCLKSFEYIVNRDVSIVFKPYTLLSIEILKKSLENATQFFDYFYTHLEKALEYDIIIIPMIRFFIFMGYSRRIFTIFIEFTKKRKKNHFLILVTYFLAEESEEFSKYKRYVLQFYPMEITNYNNSDYIFYYYFKKFLFVQNNVYLLRQLKYIKRNYEQISKKFHDYNKLLLGNWFLLNFLSSGNLISAFYFFKWFRKSQTAQFIKEFLESWSLKLGIICIKYNKWNLLKYLNHKDFDFSSKEAFWEKFRFLYPCFDNAKILSNKKIFHLLFEYNFFSYYQLLQLYYEEILLTGLEWYKEQKKMELKTMKFYDEIIALQKNNKELIVLSELLLQDDINMKEEDKVRLKKLALYLFYKFRRLILFYAGFDPMVRSLMGFLYENYKPTVALNFYIRNPHPLVNFRLKQLYQNYRDTDKIEYHQLKKIKNFKY